MCFEKHILKENNSSKSCPSIKELRIVNTALVYLPIIIVIMCSVCFTKSTSAGNQTEIKIFHINSHLIDCVGVGPRKCMQIRESTYDEWSPFYDGIEGFTFEEGYLYTIIVAITDIDDPPADGSSKAYKMLALISKKKT